jgi:hypothetical protein
VQPVEAIIEFLDSARIAEVVDVLANTTYLG